MYTIFGSHTISSSLLSDHILHIRKKCSLNAKITQIFNIDLKHTNLFTFSCSFCCLMLLTINDIRLLETMYCLAGGHNSAKLLKELLNKKGIVLAYDRSPLDSLLI